MVKIFLSDISNKYNNNDKIFPFVWSKDTNTPMKHILYMTVHMIARQLKVFEGVW